MLTENCWIKCVSQTGTLRGVAVEARKTVQELADRHKLDDVGIEGLGEALLAATLLGSYCKVGDRVNLNVQGSGYWSQALIDAYPDGKVRGYAIARDKAKATFGHDGAYGPWGDGLLSVLKTKDTDGQKPYIGTVPLVTGFLPKDLTFYWHQSEQVPSALGIYVKVKNRKVLTATAFLVQAMPGASQKEIDSLESHLVQVENISKTIETAQYPVSVLAQIFQDNSFLILGETPLRVECQCSEERVKRAVSLLGRNELNSMISEDGKATVHCDFCGTDYILSATELESMLKA